MNIKPISHCLSSLIFLRFCAASRKEVFASQVVLLKNEVKVREKRERNGWVAGAPIGCASSGGRSTLDHLQFNAIRLPLKIATVTYILSSLRIFSFQHQTYFIFYGQTQMFPLIRTTWNRLNSFWASSTQMCDNKELSSQLLIMDHCAFNRAKEMHFMLVLLILVSHLYLAATLEEKLKMEGDCQQVLQLLKDKHIQDFN